MAESAFKVLVVDDEPDIVAYLGEFIEALGYEPVLASSADEAIAALEHHHNDIIFVSSDLRMPDKDGLELRQAMLPRWSAIPFAVVSAFVDRDLALKGIDAKISAFLKKPLDEAEFKEVLEKESEPRREAIEENRAIIESFFEEAKEILEELEPLLLSLEDDPTNLDTINTVFRLVHTVKGAGALLEREDFTTLIHRYEDLISSIKNGKTIASNGVVTVLLSGYDAVIQMLNSIKDNSEATIDLESVIASFDVSRNPPQDNKPQKSSAEKESKVESAIAATSRDSNITVPTDLLDEFMVMSGETTVIRNMIKKIVRSIEKKLPGDDDVTLLGELLDEMHKINSSMQTQITELRKIPMSSVLKRIPRTVRDLSKQLGKTVKLEVEGDHLRVDTAIAQALNNSLVHIIRNSLDHGIELPSTRSASGKSDEGTLQLGCREDGENVYVKIRDDGAGINVEKIKEKMLERGQSAESIAKMSRQNVMGQIFESGLSTAKKVSNVSGRGVGMDMVRSSVDQLRGKIEVDSDLGHWTEIMITLPIPKSVVIINSLIVECCNQEFAIPQDSIVRLIRLEEGSGIHSMYQFDQGGVMDLDGDLIPVVSLAEILGLADTDSSGRSGDTATNILILSSEHRNFGLVVDRILDAEDTVLKPLHSSIERIGAFCGATFMGDGSIGLILEVEGLLNVADLEEQQATRRKGKAEDAALTNIEAPVDQVEIVLFSLGIAGMFAVRVADIYRLEEYRISDVRFSGAKEVVLYRNEMMPLIDLVEVLNLPFERATNREENFGVLVVHKDGRTLGLKIQDVRDIASYDGSHNDCIHQHRAILGSTIVRDETVTVIDIDAVTKGMSANSNLADNAKSAYVVS